MNDEAGLRFWQMSMTLNSFYQLLPSPLEALLPFTVSEWALICSEVPSRSYYKAFLTVFKYILHF